MEEVVPFTFEVLSEHLYAHPIRGADDDANDLSAEQKLSLDTNFALKPSLYTIVTISLHAVWFVRDTNYQEA